MDKKLGLTIIALLFVTIILYIMLRATALTPSEVANNKEVTEFNQNSELTEEADVTESVEEGPTDITAPVVAVPPVTIDPVPVASKGCYVGGCSRQLCSENLDIVSTCEWRESYACYQTATCERQVTGECGWTETPALNSCLLETGSDQTTIF